MSYTNLDHLFCNMNGALGILAEANGRNPADSRVTKLLQVQPGTEVRRAIEETCVDQWLRGASVSDWSTQFAALSVALKAIAERLASLSEHIGDTYHYVSTQDLIGREACVEAIEAAWSALQSLQYHHEEASHVCDRAGYNAGLSEESSGATAAHLLACSEVNARTLERLLLGDAPGLSAAIENRERMKALRRERDGNW